MTATMVVVEKMTMATIVAADKRMMPTMAVPEKKHHGDNVSGREIDRQRQWQ